MRLPLALAALFALAACDSAADGDGSGVVYRTPAVDAASGAVVVPGGDVWALGLTNGRIGAGDYTVGSPLLLRLTPGGDARPAVVYGDVPFGEAVAAVPDGDGLAVLVTESDETPGGVGSPRLTLWRTDADGTRRTALYRADDAYPAGQPLRRAADGGFVLALFSLEGLEGRVVKLRPDGDIEWTYTPADAQFVVDTAPAPDGGHVVLAAFDTGLFGLTYLDADGREDRTTSLGDDPLRRAEAVVPAGDGVAVLGLVNEPAVGVSSAVVTMVDGAGRVVSERKVLTGRLSGLAFAALPDGGFAVASSDVAEGRIDTPPSTVSRLGSDGAVVWSRSFGKPGQATRVASVVGLADGRVVAVGTVGDVFSGYGGDDTDVLVTTYAAP